MLRFWAPAGAGAQFDGHGYLLDPDLPSVWSSKCVDILSTASLPLRRSLVLLGEPGIGKSTVLKEHGPFLPSDLSVHRVHVDLSTYGEDRFVRAVIDGPEVREWISDSSQQLCLILDGFDEGSLHIPQLASILAGALRSWPCDRLWLRVACRIAHWPALLASTLHDIFGDQRQQFELLPLRRADVAQFAKQWTSPAPFLEAVEQHGLAPLASRPLTCKLLARVFERSNGSLPDTAAAMYERGLAALCEEQSPSRLAAGRTGTALPNHRLAVASRLAAVAVFTGKTSYWLGPEAEVFGDNQNTIAELCGGSEPVGRDEFHVQADALLETLQTALFTSRGEQALGWAHATFADFLAARWIDQSHLTITQVRELFLAEDGRVYPQARLTAAWLVAIAPDTYGWLAEVDPSAFIGEVELPGDALRAAVVRGILAESATISHFGVSYRGLDHPDLPAQVIASLESDDVEERRQAIWLARDCRVHQVRPTLIGIAMDVNEPYVVRVPAAHAVVDLSAGQPDDALSRLVLSADQRGSDPYDELFGIGLEASWPHTIDTAEVFTLLRAPKRANFLGAYITFIDTLATGLTDAALHVAMEWLTNPDNGDVEAFERLRDAIVRLAMQNIDTVERPLVDLVLQRAREHRPLFEVPDAAAAESISDSTVLRRRLVAAVLARQPDVDVTLWLADNSTDGAKVIQPDDLAWIAEQCDATPPSHRQPWFQLFRATYRDDDRDHLELVLNLQTTHPLYDGVVGAWLEPIRIDSAEAQQARQLWQMTHRRRTAVRPDEADRQLDDYLDAFDAGDTDAYWKAIRILHVRPGTDRYLDEHVPDVTSLRRWAETPQRSRDRLIDRAATYLASRICHPELWLHEWVVHRPSRAAYRALVLLLRVRPAALDDLTAQDWVEWAPAVVEWPVTGNGAREDDKIELILRAAQHARPELVAALLALLVTRLRQDSSLLVDTEMDQLWCPELASAIRRHLESELSADHRSELVRILLRNDTALAREHLLPHLEATSLADDPERACVAAGLLLDHDAERGVATFLQLARTRPDLAEQVLQTRTSSYMPSISTSEPAELAELYSWLAEHYPPSEDPDVEEAHWVGRREEIGHWRDAVLDRLVNSGHPQAPILIRELGTKIGHPQWLDRIEATAREHLRRAQWSPLTASELLAIPTNQSTRIVRHNADLQRLIVEALERIQQKLQGATPQAHLLWDTVAQRPKGEEDISDYLCGQLNDLIGGQGAIANREVQVRRTSRRGIGQRVDLHVAAANTRDGTVCIVIVEVKAAWNPELPTSLNDQLVNRYLKDVHSRHGIYCVAWSTLDNWQTQVADLPPDSRRSAVNRLDRAATMRELHQQAAMQQSGGHDIAVVELDISFARPVPDEKRGAP